MFANRYLFIPAYLCHNFYMLENLDHVFRRDYRVSELSESSVPNNPFKQFEISFNDIVETKVKQPNSMILSTVSTDGVPSNRVVLLKHFDDTGFVFFTNYTSAKGKDILTNSNVSLLFFSIDLERQIHVQGAAQKISYEESNSYFKSRPIKSQIAAISSHQSSRVSSRETLENDYKVVFSKYESKSPECPVFWGGYKVVPHHFEFWQGRPSRLHDRVCYELNKESNAWSVYRKSP
jgi:pyridoxamine 5'-phosphate oxidase